MLLTVVPSVAQETGNTSVKSRKRASLNPDFKAKSFIFYYDSYDGQKNKAILTCKVYYTDINTPIRNIILSCHPTATTNYFVPSGPKPLDEDFSRMCTTNQDSYMMICPDYCGYGVSSHLQHPYLVHDVTARNCFDALIPAVKAAIGRGLAFVDNKDRKLDAEAYINQIRAGQISKLPIEIAGYSQGGATALACAKLFDSETCPEDIHKCFKLLQTVCGDGPYSTIETINQYMEWGDPNRPDGGLDLAYPCVFPLIIAAAKEANNDGCMRTVNVEDYFNEEFLNTGILGDLMTKNIDTDILNAKIKGKILRLRPVDILSSNIIDKDGSFKKDSKEYKCLMRAMELADLCTGWQPKHTIKFYHIKSDNVVPYVNYSKGIMGEKGIGKLYPDYVRYYTPTECWGGVETSLIAAVKDEFDWFPDWDTMSHTSGGNYFYASYMFGQYLSK